MIYEPSDDTFLLAEQAKKFSFGSVLEVGAGSGYISAFIASSSKVKSVLAVDVSNEVISHLNKNIKNKKIKARKSDLFSNVKGRFDTIVFNPPYLPLDSREPMDSRLATTGGKKGYEIIERFLNNLNEHLTKNGTCLLLFSSLSGKDKIDEILQNNLLEPELISEIKISFESLYVYKIKRSKLLNELFDKKIVDIKKLAKGHRGLVYTGFIGKKKIAVKTQRPDIKVHTIEREADMLRRLNKVKIGSKLVFKGNNYFIYEFVEGEQIIDFLKHSSRKQTKDMFLEVLRQCRVLDKIKITKEEMTNPYKHVIIGKKVVLIDFERSHYDPDPKNVSQFCQYIMRNQNILSKKGIKFNKDDLIELSREYKSNHSESNYNKIKSVISGL